MFVACVGDSDEYHMSVLSDGCFDKRDVQGIYDVFGICDSKSTEDGVCVLGFEDLRGVDGFALGFVHSIEHILGYLILGAGVEDFRYSEQVPIGDFVVCNASFVYLNACPLFNFLDVGFKCKVGGFGTANSSSGSLRCYDSRRVCAQSQAFVS